MVNYRWYKMKIKDLTDDIGIWTSNEEEKLLKKLTTPVKLSTLSSHDRIKVDYMVKKGLVNKSGFNDPTVVKSNGIEKNN